MLDKTQYLTIDYKSYRLGQTPPLEHYHDCCELAFFVRSDIRVFLKDKQYEIGPGDVLFIDEYEIHRILYTPDKQYTRYVIHFKRSSIRAVLEQLGVPDLLDDIRGTDNRKISLNLKDFDSFRKFFEQINHNKMPVVMSREMATADIKLKLIQILIMLHGLFSRQRKQKENSHDTRQARRILEYIDHHYLGAVTLAHLEKALNLNRYHVAHVFKDWTGFTVVEYVQMKRIIAAQTLLRSTDRKIIDIGFDCGFRSVQHFCRVFKKIARCTPSEYRRLHTGKKT